MSAYLFRQARVITATSLIQPMDVLVNEGRIVAVGQTLDASGAAVVDGSGLYLAPGFIDLHLHGGGGHDFMDGTVEAFLGVTRAHARFGTTTLMPTTLACTDDELNDMFSVFLEANKHNTDGAAMAGVHLEGPYFSMEQRGAQDPRFIRNPDPAHYGPILERWGKWIRRWSSAPELPGTAEFAKALTERGILPSVAHTDAFCEDIEAAAAIGFTHLTHFYSGMSGLRRINGIRRPGVVESGYISDDLTVEVIADGMHIPPALLKQVYKGIGPNRTALVTDAMRGAGTDLTTCLLGSKKNGQTVLIEGGVAWLPDRTAFAGSVATMNRTVRTMVQLAGVPLQDAVRMASTTPAAIAKLPTKGRILPGLDADLVLFDENIDVHLTMIGGRIVYRR
ncbi:MAG: N-acetylglucosamine-6-phosphate deacetylase [Eubacteriales bacterium]|nr:N-acetylglucosamine-6-phosphate deacetylase [Clostridiales bacterium]MDD4743543.1 N-acetylglucosamine-6-phosphate deacetylase [Eubacteriales bacterium]